MIDITEGFTSVSAGFDRIDSGPCAARSPTGARITVEFQRERALAPAQSVRVRYDFAGGGTLHEGTGVARLIQTVVRRGRALYHYRVSYWIAPSALMEFVSGNVRYRTETLNIPPHPSRQQTQICR